LIVSEGNPLNPELGAASLVTFDVINAGSKYESGIKKEAINISAMSN
jgi:hypothetical protein